MMVASERWWSIGDEPAAREPLLHEATTRVVLRRSFGVYNELGAGFVEGVYCRALAVELQSAGLRVEREVPASAESIVGAHVQQVINDLTATRPDTALLLNFGPKPAFKRLVLSNTHKKTS